MYGLRSDLDLTFLLGKSVLQVCVGANEVILNFDEHISITIESKFRIRTVDGMDLVFEDSRYSAAALAGLISDQITEVQGQTNGTLRLSFSGGAILEIYDSFEHYESYQIRHGNTQIIV